MNIQGEDLSKMVVYFFFFSAHNSSLGKVMFAQASVSHSVHCGAGVVACLVPGPFQGW